MPVAALAKNILPAMGKAPAKESAEQRKKRIEALEKGLVDALGAFTDKLQELADVRKEIGDLSPMPDEIQKRLDRLTKVATSSRAPEMKDLAKAQKRKELNQNPSKFSRLLEEINEDVKETNDLDGDIDTALDNHYSGLLATLESDLEKKLPKDITAKRMDLTNRIKRLATALKKKRWKNFDAKCREFETTLLEDADEEKRQFDIRKLEYHKDHLILKAKVRSKVVDDGIKNKRTPKQVEQDLLDALDAQCKPSRSAWGKHFGMVGYSIIAGPAKNGHKTHITYDLNSWTNSARSGDVSVKGRSIQDVFDDLFKVNWTYQIHATAECATNNGNFPHVYLYGAENHWGTIITEGKMTQKEVNEMKAHLRKQLDDFEDDIKKKIKVAINDYGDI